MFSLVREPSERRAERACHRRDRRANERKVDIDGKAEIGLVRILSRELTARLRRSDTDRGENKYEALGGDRTQHPPAVRAYNRGVPG